MKDTTKEYEERAMNALTNERQRQVIEMRNAGFNYREIGEQMGMSSNNAMCIFDEYTKRVRKFVRVLELVEEKGSALDVPVTELRHISPKYGGKVARAMNNYMLRGSTLRHLVSLHPKHLLKQRDIGPKSVIAFMEDVRRNFRKDKSVSKMTRYFVSRMDYNVRSPIPHKVMDAIKVIREHGYSVTVKSKYDEKQNESRQ